MDRLHEMPHELDRDKMQCKAIIESPRGSRNKFKYLPESGVFGFSHVLPQGFSFPIDFGFIPSTTADDGDALDILVLMDEPAHVGCVLDVRLIGVVRVKQTEGDKETQNDRLLGVVLQTFEYADVKSVQELRPSLVEQLSEFIGLYNKNQGKTDRVEGVSGPGEAMKLLEKAIQNFEKQA